MKLLLVCLMVSLWAVPVEAQDGSAILEKLDSLYFSHSAHFKMKLSLQGSTSTEYDLEWFSRGQHNVMIRVIGPDTAIGKKFLKVGKDLWVFDPDEVKSLKISRVGALRRFLDSEFSRDEIFSLNGLSEEYNVDFEANGKSIKLILIPRMVTPIVWDKIVIELHPEFQYPLTKEYFSENGSVFKKVLYSQPEVFNGRHVPTVINIINYQQPTNKSKLVLSDIVFDGPIEPRIFSMKAFENLIDLTPKPVMPTEVDEKPEGSKVEPLESNPQKAD